MKAAPFFAVLPLLVSFMGVAHAQDVYCDNDVLWTGTSCRDICVDDATHEYVECNLDANGVDATGAPEITVIYHSDTAIMGFGIDGRGVDFCCIVQDLHDPCETLNPVNVVVNGTNLSDVIKLTGAAVDLLCTDATVNGAGDDDFIYGSNDTSNVDHLYGANGADTIFGKLGDDFIYGENGPDDLFGGGGADYIEGGTQDDDILGGGGNDEVYGGDGQDRICGDEDAVNDGQNDLLYGESHDDQIYDSSTGSTLSGGSGYDACGVNATCDDPTVLTTCPL